MNIPVDISAAVLKTERLILRPWCEDDLNDFYEYASVEEVGRMVGWEPHKSKEESLFILRKFIDEKKTFAIVLKENGKVIGSIGLEEMLQDLGEPYTSLKGREIGYVLSKDYWGNGLMPEAVNSVIDYCFNSVGCDFLQCSHSVHNLRSRRVIEKCGFKFVNEYEREIKIGTFRLSRFYVILNPSREI